jgi:hypothetical protein
MNSAGHPESDESGFRANPYAWLDFGEGHAAPVQVPNWVPFPIADRIFMLSRRVGQWHGTPELLTRIANDPKLRIVWSEIFKRRRANYKPTEAYLHSVRMSPKKLLAEHVDLFEFYAEKLREQGKVGDAERLTSRILSSYPTSHELQGLAACYLFQTFFEYVDDLSRPIILTEKQVKKTRKELVSAIRSLKAGGIRLRGLGYAFRADVSAVDRAVAKCEAELESLGKDAIILGRGKGDVKLRVCVIHFATTMHDLFGKYLTGSVETLVRFALPSHKGSVGAIIENHFGDGR